MQTHHFSLTQHVFAEQGLRAGLGWNTGSGPQEALNLPHAEGRDASASRLGTGCLALDVVKLAPVQMLLGCGEDQGRVLISVPRPPRRDAVRAPEPCTPGPANARHLLPHVCRSPFSPRPSSMPQLTPHVGLGGCRARHPGTGHSPVFLSCDQEVGGPGSGVMGGFLRGPPSCRPLPCPHMVFLCVHISFSCEDPSPIGPGPLHDPINIVTSLKTLSPSAVTF